MWHCQAFPGERERREGREGGREGGREEGRREEEKGGGEEREGMR